MRFIAFFVPGSGTRHSSNPAESQRPWVSLDSSGKLVYRTLAHGDHIVDFSYAGYMGGGVPFPNRIPIRRKLAPSGGDDTAAISAPLMKSRACLSRWISWRDRSGARDISVQRTLKIAARGCPARGRPDEDGTTLKMTGDPHAAVTIAGKQEIQVLGTAAHIADAYVPSGARSITLDDASAFAPGSSIGLHATRRRNGYISWAWTGWTAMARRKPGSAATSQLCGQ